MEMTEAEQKFARAALAVFQRYGVRKTTMEEIAVEAGVSKPTLYATFRNKDAALGGSIRLAKSAVIKSVTDEWATTSSLPERLEVFFEKLVLAGFDMLHQSPDAQAFETAVGEASQSAINAMRAAEIDAVAGIFEDVQGLETLGLSPGDFAQFVVTSAMNAKRLSQSREELQDYLAVLKTSAAALLK